VGSSHEQRLSAKCVQSVGKGTASMIPNDSSSLGGGARSLESIVAPTALSNRARKKSLDSIDSYTVGHHCPEEGFRVVEAIPEKRAVKLLVSKKRI